MAQSFDRYVSVQVVSESLQSIQWADLRLGFKVTYKDENATPTARIDIYNLSSSSRKWLVAEASRVIIRAGYVREFGVLFSGKVQDVSIDYTRLPDIITVIEAGDGEDEIGDTTVRVSLSRGTSIISAVQAVMNAVGLSDGYIDPSLNLTQSMLSGRMMVGPARKYLDQLADDLDARWWVADGVLHFVRRGSALPGTILHVTSTSGLVGSPKETRKKVRGRTRVTGVEWTMLLRHDFRPGMMAQLDSRDFHGVYVAKSVVHTGDSGYDDAYYTEVQATEFDL